MEKAKELWNRGLAALSTSQARRALLPLGCFLGGILASLGVVFGRFAPFGVALAAACPYGGMWGAALGAFLGYLLPSPVYLPLRYEAALLGVAAIRWSLSQLSSVANHPLFAPAAAFLPLMTTGAALVVLANSLPYTAALYVAESLLGAGCAYFFWRCARLRPHSGPLSGGDAAALAATLGVGALAFSGIQVAGVSLGRVLLATLVVLCARAGGVAGGAVAGVAAGAVQGLSTAGLSYLSGAYGLGGLMAGVFAPMGRVAAAVAFALSHGVASLQVGASGREQILRGAVEVAIATGLSLCAPQSPWAGRLFAPAGDALSGQALRENMVLRLRHGAKALSQVGDSVEEISQKLSALCAPSLRQAFDRSVEAVCAGCGAKNSCWRLHKEETLEALGEVAKTLRRRGAAEDRDFPAPLARRCGRLGELRDQLNRQYSRYLLREEAQLRAQEVQEAAQGHFRTTAAILEEMAGEFAQYQQFDQEAAGRVTQALEDQGLAPRQVCCRLDRFGRMTVEAVLAAARPARVNRAALTRAVGAACGRAFSPPTVSKAGEETRLQMCQRPGLDVGRGFSQRSAGGAAFCGDCASVFYDGRGRLIALLCDGMGAGGRAAVDGAMACAMMEGLLKAGIGFAPALDTVNAALLAKSGDESFSTLDAACVDLFTGWAEFSKAGAACTLLRRGRRVEVLEAGSVPVGILPQVEAVRTRRELSPGDVAVLVSDGVTAAGQEWLEDLVLHWDEGENPNQLAQQITDEAARRRSDGRQDDITALVLCLR